MLLLGSARAIAAQPAAAAPIATTLATGLAGGGGSTSYALVTLVGDDVGGKDVDGRYRADGPDDAGKSVTIGLLARR